MSNLSIATALEKNRLDSDVPLLVALDITPVFRETGVAGPLIHVVRNSESITFNGNVYVASMFDVSFSSELGTQGQVSMSMNDFSGAIRTKMEEYGGGIGFIVNLLILNPTQLSQPPEFSHEFEVLSASAKDYEIEFSLGAENDVTKVFPRNVQRRNACRWRYKDADTCGYIGTIPDCDYSLRGPNGCAAHFNTIRFGGSPGIRNNGMRYR